MKQQQNWEPLVWHTIKLMSGNHKRKSKAWCAWLTLSESSFAAFVYILQSVRLAYLIWFALAPACPSASSFLCFPTVDSAPFNNWSTRKTQRSPMKREKEAEMLKCVSIWRTNGWSACYQQSGVVCWKMAITETGESGGQMCTGRNADTQSRSLMFTLVIFNLRGIWVHVHISCQEAWTLPALKSQSFVSFRCIYALRVWAAAAKQAALISMTRHVHVFGHYFQQCSSFKR